MSSGNETTVGMVGLGTMGSAMATHLLAAGFAVVGYDIAVERVREFADRGGRPARSAADVAGRCHVLITSLPSGRALHDVVAGTTGVVAGGRAGLLAIETSTLSIDDKESARRLLEHHGITMLDCPLSGTGAQARTRDLAVFASGDPAAVAQVGPVLAAFSRAHLNVGPFGAGTRLKLIANHLVTIHNLAAAEALLLAKRSGLDPELVLHAVSAGAGTSRMFEVRGPLMARDDYHAPGMRVETFLKDIDIITAFARALHCPTPLFSTAVSFYEAAMAQDRGDQDTACVHAVLRGMSEPRREAAAMTGDPPMSADPADRHRPSVRGGPDPSGA
jgi:putative dehydrogenase